MKLGKIIILIILILVLAVGGALFYLFSNLNVLVKSVVESEGPKVTQTDVLLRQVDIDLGLDQAGGELNQFTVANPQGFTQPHVFSADTIRVKVDPSSVVGGEVIVLKDITIEGLKLFAEQKGLSTNLQALLKNVESFSGKSSASDTSDSGEKADVRIMVEHLKFADSGLSVTTEKYGEFELTLPSFELNNLGDKKTGLTPAELGVAIVKPLVKKAKRQLESALKERAKDELKAKAEEKLKEKLGDDAEQKIKGIKGLFGR